MFYWKGYKTINSRAVCDHLRHCHFSPRLTTSVSSLRLLIMTDKPSPNKDIKLVPLSLLDKVF